MSNGRNFSMIEYFRCKGLLHEPRLRFKGTTKQDFVQWKEELLVELRGLLGPMPKPVPLNPEIVWEIEEDNLIKRRVLLDTEANMSVATLVNIPKDALRNPAPAIIYNHGHGQYGKDSVMGVRSGNTPQRNAEIDSVNYDYGLQMAKRGYVTIAVDWRGFGERCDGDPYPGRDKCNVYFIHSSLMGINLLALDIFDGIRVIDYVSSLECVDAKRIGAMGLSFGGTMTTWLSLLDERIIAADIICLVHDSESLQSTEAISVGHNIFQAFTQYAIYQIYTVLALLDHYWPRLVCVMNVS